MTATDELRRMLDERGVEWDALSSKEGDRITRWEDANGRYVSALDCGETQYFADFYWQPTPQQAVDATLGCGTCHNAAPSYLDFLCSECGFVHYHSDENDSGDGNEWRYCPNCGRKVVDE